MHKQGRGSPLDDTRIERHNRDPRESGGDGFDAIRKKINALLSPSAAGGERQDWDLQIKFCRELLGHLDRMQGKLHALASTYLEHTEGLIKAEFMASQLPPLVADATRYIDEADAIRNHLRDLHEGFTQQAMRDLGMSEQEVRDVFYKQ